MYALEQKEAVERVNAILPKDFEEHTVEFMAVGETAWIVPWGMWVDRERRCWLNPDYATKATAAGTVQMRIEHRVEGFHVWLVADHRYILKSRPSYNSGEDVVYLPVIALH